MASIFTYDPDPPEVSSPWIASEGPSRPPSRRSCTPVVVQSYPEELSEYGVTKLQAEPQNGPTEYKLHLLLRPRRAFTHMSTINLDGKMNQKEVGDSFTPKATTNNPASSSQPRQQRLQHLTTQLLWRLQQSYPYHSSSSKELTIPRLLDDNVDLQLPIQVEAPIPGLEESRGALYEIGVSDDGTLVGLTKDEMDESILTLKVMAASLGCCVDVVRTVVVGDCRWVETVELTENAASASAQVYKEDKLWVAEAFITPNLGFRDDVDHNGKRQNSFEAVTPSSPTFPGALDTQPSRGNSTTPQLRVTLTGPTTSGKSSLLGTLSMGTLDNGRGKSRLSLLKHRHEMASGVTSSVAQELIGYRGRTILNFSHGNIESWVNIHDYSDKGRLVFVSDSGGHPRYRRTVLRGLMNWAPHWSILCIAADDAEVSTAGCGATLSGQDFDADLTNPHLTLSLKLDVPLAVVITKLDLASRAGLQKTLVKVLDAIKAAGRTPKILQPDQRQHDGLNEIPQEDFDKVQRVISSMNQCGSLTKYVPIVLTSALKGTGIGLVHALFGSLPISPMPTAHDYVGLPLNPEQPKSLFHIDDTFTLLKPYDTTRGQTEQQVEQGIIVSGHVRFGNFSVGDLVVLGPFPPEDDCFRSQPPEERSSPGSFGLSLSNPSSAEPARIAINNAVSASTIPGEWLDARILSIRNLRLPVRMLESGQAGSIGFVAAPDHNRSISNRDMGRIRRGMVIAVPSGHMLKAGISLQAASGFTASFDDPAVQTVATGSLVNVFVACVRAAVRVLEISSRDPLTPEKTRGDEDDIFDLNKGLERCDGVSSLPSEVITEVKMELLHNREWFELGSRLVLIGGGSQDKSGLEGYVGRITEIVD